MAFTVPCRTPLASAVRGRARGTDDADDSRTSCGPTSISSPCIFGLIRSSPKPPWPPARSRPRWSVQNAESKVCRTVLPDFRAYRAVQLLAEDVGVPGVPVAVYMSTWTRTLNSFTYTLATTARGRASMSRAVISASE